MLDKDDGHNYWVNMNYINYIKWSVNKAMDLLNGRPHIFSLFPLRTNLHENILKLYIDEKEYLLVKHGLQNEVMEIIKYER